MSIVVREYAGEEVHAPSDLTEFERKLLAVTIKPSPGAKVLAAFDGDNIVGMMSWRIDDDGRVKRINEIAFRKRAGIGAAMVRALCKLTVGHVQYSKSVPEAVEFCKSLGMYPVKTLEDGRTEMELSAADVARLAAT